MSLLLTLDTSTHAGSVAVSRAGELLGEILLQGPGNHTDHLLCQIRDLLAALELDLSQVEALGVVLGPGSFTGVRVGVATAKGLAQALERPLYGVTSLEVVAHQLPMVDLPLCVLLDARKQEVYAGHFRWDGEELQTLKPGAVGKVEAMVAQVTEPTLLLGRGAQLYRERLEQCLGARARFAPASVETPRAATVAAMVQRQIAAGVAAPPLCHLLPCYIRPSEAEIAAARNEAQIERQRAL